MLSDLVILFFCILCLKMKNEWLTQTLFEARGGVDNYIQEPVETEGFILWKDSQERDRKDSGAVYYLVVLETIQIQKIKMAVHSINRCLKLCYFNPHLTHSYSNIFFPQQSHSEHIVLLCYGLHWSCSVKEGRRKTQ